MPTVPSYNSPETELNIIPGSAPSTYLPSRLFTSGDNCPRILET